MLLYDYLEKHTDYDTDLLWDNLLRVENLADLKRNFQWNYVLSGDTSKKPGIAAEKKLALVMHIHFPELIEACKNYASAMPETADIYITTNTEEKKKLIEEKKEKQKGETEEEKVF